MIDPLLIIVIAINIFWLILQTLAFWYSEEKKERIKEELWWHLFIIEMMLVMIVCFLAAILCVMTGAVKW